jgi:hypothetical protein
MTGRIPTEEDLKAAESEGWKMGFHGRPEEDEDGWPIGPTGPESWYTQEEVQAWHRGQRRGKTDINGLIDDALDDRDMYPHREY